jgi:hypothetical protein
VEVKLNALGVDPAPVAAKETAAPVAAPAAATPAPAKDAASAAGDKK